MLDEGRYASITEMAAAERIDRGFAGQLLRLTLLAPDIVEDVLNGCRKEDARLPTIMEPIPLNWVEQRQMLSR